MRDSKWFMIPALVFCVVLDAARWIFYLAYYIHDLFTLLVDWSKCNIIDSGEPSVTIEMIDKIRSDPTP